MSDSVTVSENQAIEAQHSLSALHYNWKEVVESLPFAPTEEQTDIIIQIYMALAAKPEPPFSGVLQGAAGTGKTTTLTALIKLCVKSGISVTVAAFTHKACSVVSANLESAGISGVEVATIHSLFNLRPKPAKYGEKEAFNQIKLPDLGMDFLIIDECSMIGTELYDIVMKDTQSYNVPVLFAGDACQLRPVGEDEKSKTFKTGEKFKLTQVLRHDGAILDLATQIRTERHLPVFKSSDGDNSKITVYKNLSDFEQTWLNHVVRDSERSSIMLCYTNSNRRTYNIRARAALYGEDAPRFMKGDKILALAPVIRDEKMLIANNELVTIIGEPTLSRTAPVPALPEFVYNVWRIQTSYGVIDVLDSVEDEKLYWKQLRALGREINKEMSSPTAASDWRVKRNAKMRWSREYFPLKNAFADVDFSYALTIHKSQGSTFDCVYVSNDYVRARGDQRRLLYVAVTRAASELHLIHNGY